MGSGSSSSSRPRGALSASSSNTALSTWADWAAKSLDPDAITSPLQMQVGEYNFELFWDNGNILHLQIYIQNVAVILPIENQI